MRFREFLIVMSFEFGILGFREAVSRHGEREDNEEESREAAFAQEEEH